MADKAAHGSQNSQLTRLPCSHAGNLLAPWCNKIVPHLQDSTTWDAQQCHHHLGTPHGALGWSCLVLAWLGEMVRVFLTCDVHTTLFCYVWLMCAIKPMPHSSVCARLAYGMVVCTCVSWGVMW
jgi:hypothetical protein